MPSFSHRSAALRAALVVAAALAAAGTVSAQTLVDPVIGPGEIRVGGGGQFLGSSERFGPDGDRVDLGVDLTRESAASLVPGLAGLTTALQALTGSSGPFRLGAATASVSHNQVRVPLSVDVGVFDRLTVGLTVPLVRSTVEADVRIAADENADLGLNPRIQSPATVTAFFDALEARLGAAAALESQVCTTDPGSEACTAASALAGALANGRELLDAAYGSSGLFPATGTVSGDALLAWASDLDGALAAQGLDALGTAPPLAAAVLDREGLATLVSDARGPFRAAPLGSYGGRWDLGDVEARVGARLLQGERLDSTGTATLAWSLAAMGTVRLPTGAADTTGIFLDRGWDDGQMDLEGGAWLSVATPRLALRARATFTVQQAGEVERRIAPYGEVLSGAGDIALLDWDPGDGFTIEVEPALRLAPALSLAASWRYTSRGADTYAYADGFTAPASLTEIQEQYYPDPTLLEVGTEYSLQEIGGSLTYRSRGLPETEGGGFESFLRVHTALSGSGGRVPAGVRAEFGLRVVRRIWGG